MNENNSNSVPAYPVSKVGSVQTWPSGSQTITGVPPDGGKYVTIKTYFTDNGRTKLVGESKFPL